MLTSDGWLSWFQRLDIPEETRRTIEHIRSSGPSRRVGGGRSNVSGRYPSRKMGVTIQFESHRIELAGIYEMEHDAGVLEYFDQPPPIPLQYESPNGRPMKVRHTPDFFVVRETEAGWEEWKTEQDLERLSERNPNRYRTDDAGRWRCPPGIAHAEPLGLYYRVRSSADIDATFQRNIQFLEDYLRAGSKELLPAICENAMALASATPGMPLEDLLRLSEETVTPDDIFTMIAAGILYVDLRTAALAEPSNVKVFDTKETVLRSMSNAISTAKPLSAESLRCGSRISWDGRNWEVVNVGETAIGLLSDRNLAELPIAAFEKLIRENRAQMLPVDRDPDADRAIRERLSQASEADLQTGSHRSGLISQYVEFGVLPASDVVPARTFFRWLGLYRKAEAAYGTGFLGLLPQSSGRGNRTAKLPETSRRLMQESIDSDYETLKQKTKYASWIRLKRMCEVQSAPVPSYKTFCLAVDKRSVFDQTLKRKGRRASYQVATFHWDLDLTTPRHGDRPFEIAHIDHTELDVECVAGAGHRLGRPWLTLLTDAFSRRTLAFYLTFDPPSYRSCMMTLRECVRRFSRFPQILVVDGGREFESTYFETLLARYQCTKKTRPPAQPRFGSISERLFGTTNTQFIHNLRGNTQITRNVRQVTKSVDPKGLAIWPLPELHGRLSEYLYEIQDTLAHPALGQTPREVFRIGMAKGGVRIHRMVTYNEEFMMLTLPTTAKGTAKVIVSRGVKINHIYYWCDAFRQVEGEIVPVRYDPFDAGSAYAFVGKQWLQCHSEHFGALKGRSEREIMLATTELHRRRRNHSSSFHITAQRLAAFLESVEAEEVLLTQRLRDRESLTMRLGTAVGEKPAVEECELADPHDDAAEDEAIGELYGAF